MSENSQRKGLALGHKYSLNEINRKFPRRELSLSWNGVILDCFSMD